MRLLSTNEEVRGLGQGYTDRKYYGEEAKEIFNIAFSQTDGCPDRVATNEQHTLLLLVVEETGYLLLYEHHPDQEINHKLLVYGSSDGSGQKAAHDLYNQLVPALEMSECDDIDQSGYEI